MSTQSNKAKGRRAQQQVKEILHDYFSHLQDDDIDTATMSSNGNDIILSPRAKEDIPWDCEVKYGKQPPWRGGIDQAEENAGDGRIPLYLRREPYGDWYAVLRFEDLLDLKALWSDGNEEIVAELKQLISEL